jgi:hypothetical protein
MRRMMPQSRPVSPAPGGSSSRERLYGDFDLLPSLRSCMRRRRQRSGLQISSKVRKETPSLFHAATCSCEPVVRTRRHLRSPCESSARAAGRLAPRRQRPALLPQFSHPLEEIRRPSPAAIRSQATGGRAARPAWAGSTGSPAPCSAFRPPAARRTARRPACPTTRGCRAPPGPRRRAPSPSSPGRPGTPPGLPKTSRKRACSFATTASISARDMRGRLSCQSMWSHAWMPTACPAFAASRMRATVSLRPADVGRGEQRPVEHRLQPVGRRGARGEDLLHEALPEDTLDGLAARVGPEREEERRPRPSFAKRSRRRGTPSSVPRYVSTSTLRARVASHFGGFRPFR